MAASAPFLSQPSQAFLTHTPPKRTSIKSLAELPGLTSIPPIYIFPTNANDQPFSDAKESIPTIDFSHLTSNNPDERSKVLQELGDACLDWGFFMVINHGVPESMMQAIIEACRGFFELTEEEKQEFEGKHMLDPISCGTSSNVSADKVLFWRDFLKVFQHPEFHSPNKPAAFSEIALEFSTRVRQVARIIVRGISESLGLEGNYIDEALNLEDGLQFLAANFYPPCPQPELALGLPPHSDHGLLTLLIQNEIMGLQVQHKGEWINVNPIPNSFLANVGDHIEILSNGKYKSVLHRAVVNNKDTRISIAMPHGPALNAVVAPASKLLDHENNPPAYKAMKYKDYLELQQSSKLDGKSCLERIQDRTI
ncbi:2-oxoglutarate and Fe(II)-dependent oxygenase superfamily protein, putative [Theobroma cacao]|uniref:2-oxoglutarate and Fe(II)-dependent oxygenase superfamily protein, putative n=1 Tax=Theobroma cacao TaxID=3641 RepID=A0A061E1A4_THECC|nr:2-oxoglutarate and Fe(II)-dependent oxygenase superfamily protein, putative [Theobroma cacao]